MAEHFSKWVSLEEHGLNCGVGSALLEWLNDQRVAGVSLRRLGVPDAFIHELGNQAYTRSRLCLDAEGLTRFLKAKAT